MVSFMVSNTPLPTASLLPATATASNRFKAPSADKAVPGRIEATITMGLLVRSTSVKK